MQDRFLRAEAANNNSFVGLPLFAGAIVCPLYSLSSSLPPFSFSSTRRETESRRILTRQIAGNMARIPASTLNAFALTYLGFRTAFVVLYVNGTTSMSYSILT